MRCRLVSLGGAVSTGAWSNDGASSKRSSRSPAPSSPSSGTYSPTPPRATHDLGAEYHTRRIDTERHTRSHLRQLESLGDKVTLAAAA